MSTKFITREGIKIEITMQNWDKWENRYTEDWSDVAIDLDDKWDEEEEAWRTNATLNDFVAYLDDFKRYDLDNDRETDDKILEEYMERYERVADLDILS